MDTNPPRPDLIPQCRELRKPYFLYRTPDGLGTYLQREVCRALFSRKDPLTRFLVPAQLSGPQVKPPKVEYDFEGHAAADFVRMKYLSRAEIAAFKAAATDFLQKADPDAVEKVTPHERELRTHFRLPDPDEEPDAFWLYGLPNDRKLCILWGCELKQNSSLPLLPGKSTAPGASVAERLEARATPWTGLQAQALELIQKNKEPLAEFIGTRVVDAKGQLKTVTVGGKALPADAVSVPRFVPASDLRRLTAAATAFYAKAHPTEESVPSFEKELRAALRFPDPAKKPGAYVLVKTATGRRLHVLIDGNETLADTVPIVADDVLGLPAEETGPEGAHVPVPVVDQLKARLAPKGKFIMVGGGIVAVAALVVLVSGVFTDKTPPKLLEATAENTPTQVLVRFSKPVDPETFLSAEEKKARSEPKPPVIAPKRNFQLKDADGERVEILDIAADPVDRNRVRLTTDRLADTKDYTLTVRGVADRSGHISKTEDQARLQYVDTLPPRLSGDLSADGADSHKIIMKFNKPLDERFSTAPANFSIPGYIVTKAELSPGEQDTLVLTANNPFKNGERYTLTFSGISDRARRPNSIREPVTVEFPYINLIPPKVLDIKADRTQVELAVVFSEPVQKGAAETPGNYVIATPGLPDVTAISSRLLDDASTVELRVPAMVNGKDYTLKVIGIEDRSTPPNKIAANTAVKFNYTGKPIIEPPTINGEIHVRGDGLRLTVVFNEALDLSTAVDASHYRLDDPVVKIAQVIPKPGDPKIVSLQLDQPLQETKRYRLTVSGLSDFVGNTIPASGYTSKPFTGPGLAIVSRDVLGIADVKASDDGSVLTLTFTEEVDRASASKLENFSLSDNVKIGEVLFDEGTFRQVKLKLVGRLAAQRYTLVVRNVGLRSDPSRVQNEITQSVPGPGAPFVH